MATEQVTLRVPPEVAEWLRERALKERRTQTAIFVAALEKYREHVQMLDEMGREALRSRTMRELVRGILDKAAEERRAAGGDPTDA